MAWCVVSRSEQPRSSQRITVDTRVIEATCQPEMRLAITRVLGVLSGFYVRFLVASTAGLHHAPQAGGDFVQVGIGGGDPDDEVVDVVVGRP